VYPVAVNAHARFDAYSRTYEYYIHFERSPFLRHYSTMPFFREMNWERVDEATLLIPQFKDFTSLCRMSVDFKTNICDVSEARWDRISRPAIAGGAAVEMMRFTITANRFLRGMVRMIVAALIAVGRGRISVAEFRAIVDSKATFPFAISAPPQGLYLTQVLYRDPKPLAAIEAEKVEEQTEEIDED
jgi:tRNA pseudouridine38-40 synthase